MPKKTECPMCNAPLPPKGRFCLECGCDLYQRGLRHRPLHLIPIGLAVLAAGVLAVWLVTYISRPRTPPDIAEVSDLTKDLLGRVASKDGIGIVKQFYKPDAERYEKTGLLLRNIARHDRLVTVKARTLDKFDEVKKLVRQHGSEHPQYVAEVLVAVTFRKGLLNTALGARLGEDRTNAFIGKFYLSRVFEGVDVAQAEIIGLTRAEDTPAGEKVIVATISYPKPPSPMSGVANPTTLRWRQLASGRWVLDLGSPEQYHLEEVLALLGRVEIGR